MRGTEDADSPRPAVLVVAETEALLRRGVGLPWQGKPMAMFITIGYGDQDGYDRTSAEVRQAAHAHDDSLTRAGVVMGRAGSPVQVRNPDAAGVTMTDGPFLRSGLPVAGFAIIEADTMKEAVEKVSQTPCAVAHGVVEVWPLTT